MKQTNSFVVDDTERHRYGERVSTDFVESAVNQVLAKRLVKRQQMQWTKKGTPLLCRPEPRCSIRSGRTVFGSSTPAFG